jgi:hypothetical protein
MVYAFYGYGFSEIPHSTKMCHSAQSAESGLFRLCRLQIWEENQFAHSFMRSIGVGSYKEDRYGLQPLN